jgi:hypothetical protein
MTAFGIFAIEYAPDRSIVNQWLDSFDAADRGHIQFSPDPQRAMRFASETEALAGLAIVPAGQPSRPDGNPNRPLRAFAVELRRLPDA